MIDRARGWLQPANPSSSPDPRFNRASAPVERPRFTFGTDKEQADLNPAPGQYFYNLNNDHVSQWMGDHWEVVAAAFPDITIPLSNDQPYSRPASVGGSAVSVFPQGANDPPITDPAVTRAWQVATFNNAANIPPVVEHLVFGGAATYSADAVINAAFDPTQIIASLGLVIVGASAGANHLDIHMYRNGQDANAGGTASVPGIGTETILSALPGANEPWKVGDTITVRLTCTAGAVDVTVMPWNLYQYGRV